MTIKTTERSAGRVAVVSSPKPVLTDGQTALDLMMTVKYEAGISLIALDKNCLAEDFFILSRGLAGEILQKFINYQFKLAIFGDFSIYTSKPLRDFIYESNKGKDVFFASTEIEAVDRLLAAP